MSTKSIFKSIVIKENSAAEILVSALEQAQKSEDNFCDDNKEKSDN